MTNSNRRRPSLRALVVVTSASFLLTACGPSVVTKPVALRPIPGHLLSQSGPPTDCDYRPKAGGDIDVQKLAVSRDCYSQAEHGERVKRNALIKSVRVRERAVKRTLTAAKQTVF